MSSTTTSHEAAQKKLWKQEERELKARAHQIAQDRKREITTAQKAYRAAKKEADRTWTELQRVTDRQSKSTELQQLESRLAALRGRLEA